MNKVVLVAPVATVGNLIQGWDNAVVGGEIAHIKREYRWEDKPSMVGLTVPLLLIGATVITMCSGGISDWLGHPLLCCIHCQRRSNVVVSKCFPIAVSAAESTDRRRCITPTKVSTLSIVGSLYSSLGNCNVGL